MYPLINEKGVQVTKDLEKAEALNEFFASVLTVSQASHFPQVPEPPGEGWRNEDPLRVSKEQVQDHLMELNRHRSLGSDNIHPMVLRKLADNAAD